MNDRWIDSSTHTNVKLQGEVGQNFQSYNKKEKVHVKVFEFIEPYPVQMINVILVATVAQFETTKSERKKKSYLQNIAYFQGQHEVVNKIFLNLFF